MRNTGEAWSSGVTGSWLKRCGDEKFIVQKVELNMTFSLHYKYVFDFNDIYCTHIGSYLYIITINYNIIWRVRR